MDVSQIEGKIKLLVDKYDELNAAHQTLQDEVNQLRETCKQLQIKRDLAVKTIEGIVNRIKEREGVS